MSNIYLYADEASRDVLSSNLQKLVLIGSDFGYGNFGDVLQHVNSLNATKQARRFATVSVMAANAIGFAKFPAWARMNYGADSIVFVADYPLILDDSSPDITLVCEIRNLAAIHMYGGGFLNSYWGDYVLGVAEYFLRLAPDAAYVISGQQVSQPYHHRVLKHIEEFKPALVGVRDDLSHQSLYEVGFNPDFSFDDATEALLDLRDTLPLQFSAGLLMHVNASDYTANDVHADALGSDLRKLQSSRWGHGGITLFQAYRDPRYEVNDSRETLKTLDVAFPFIDLRLIELASLVVDREHAHIAKPIVGDLGYSCSYHIALWLQLSGIPCWLRSSNPFYDQKSRALQVTQDLDSFLAAPLLSDHRANLDRRAAWNRKLRSFLTDIPDVYYSCTITNDFKHQAPWPFFFKGKPTLQEIFSKAETAESNLGLARREISELYDRIETLTEQLTEVGDECDRQRDRAETNNEEIATLRAELTRVYQQPWRLLTYLLQYHILLLVSKFVHPVSKRASKRYAAAAGKRDPWRFPPSSG